MKWLNKILLASTLSILMTSCGDDDKSVDLEKPTADIEITRENGTYSPGSSILINANFFDNVALKECQVSIASLRSLKGWDTDWDSEMYKISLSGKQVSLNSVRVLEDIPVDIYYGEYRLSFKVLDEANNYSIYEIDILIE
ncbi:DUF4625 domain-containing protein [Carboxylicivirga mesophila]|uniref:DUF4625 domain-containing protein n=1 Tax=Carboxylicivirga mesophila TaxID=1166478 RepID=A0ABS5KF18_9BACT|nr:DUF4625 domain-containing protein [Carboxylicivirga mesophila]MBS2213477.1 DUF4625 domain-containing protein [Carboxylicivirga mesophila]